MQTATKDKLKRFELTVSQPVNGYRFSLDALLLADFTRLAANDRLADLGTGCGVVPLVLSRMHSAITVVGIEADEEMARLARLNTEENGLDARFSVVATDLLNLREHFPVSSFDAVVSNPPYRSSVSGRISPHRGRDTARHESTAGIGDFLAAAKYLVKPSGRIFFVYHPDRLIEFIRCAGEQKLAVLRLRMVHGSLAAPARIFLAELAKGRKGTVTVLPPLIIHDDTGEYTGEARVILGEGGG